MFISHASEDKDQIARPLEKELRSRGLTVWYDESVLRAGDSLYQQIRRGLATSRYGIVILSHDFFAKSWPQEELSALFGRVIGGEVRVIPVWHGLSSSDVSSYDPLLADKYAFRTDKMTVAEIATRIVADIQVLDLEHTRRSKIVTYRRLTRAFLDEGQSRFVDVGATDIRQGICMSAADIIRSLADGSVLAVVGVSGCGKSFLARHLGLRHGDDGRLVAWIRADEYEGRFDDLLEQAMAPFGWQTLLDAAKQFGIAITVVLDGLNECPNNRRSRLLRELQAFMFRYPATVLITSTTVDGLPDTLGAAVLRVNEPDEQARLEFLASYGAKHPERISDQFRTPHDLSIAADCESELDESASVAELHHAYIRRLAPTEQLRAGLRSLARLLHSKLRTSMPELEADTILNSTERGLTPRQVDEVLGCGLLVKERNRVRFRHEIIGQFLAAEDVVHSATSGQHLGRSLAEPANMVLVQPALGIIGSDHRMVWEALEVLASPGLVFSALTAGYGFDIAELAAQEIRDMLQRAIDSTATEKAKLESGEGFYGRWETERRWTEWMLALFAAAGRGLTRGLFVDEVCELIDRTDEVCLAQARRLEIGGERDPASLVIAATYTQTAARTDGYGLAASYIVQAFERSADRNRFTAEWRPAGLANRFTDGAHGRSWGRFYLALLSVDPDDVSDQALFASLLPRAWNAGGYRLQLEALDTARFFWGSIEPHRSEILEFVSGLDPSHWGLSSSRIEVLVSFGEIESSTTIEDLRAYIRTTISDPEDIAYCLMARGIVSSQFEEEAIVGPYFAAVEGLTRDEKVRLFTMAVRAPDPFDSFNLRWTLERLTELVPTGDPALDEAARSLFATFLDGPPDDAIMPAEAAEACLVAIRGWAKFESALPPTTAEPTPEQQAWRLVASLLLSYEHNDAAADAEETWRQLLAEPNETILTLASLEDATFQLRQHPQPPALARLTEDYPQHLRRLFEWALANPTEVPADRLHRRFTAPHFVVRMLGRCRQRRDSSQTTPSNRRPRGG